MRPIPSQIAQDFVQPFVTHTREVADKIYDSMSTYGQQAIQDSTATGDVTFYDTGIPTPGGGTLKLPVGIDNFSLGKNPTVFGTVLNVTGGLLDITIDVGLAFLGPVGLAASFGLNTAEAAGAAAEQIEKKVTEKLKDPEYLKSEEYQRALKKAGGNKDLANAYLLKEAKGMLLATGVVGGVADATVGKLIANRLTPDAVKLTGTLGIEGLTETTEEVLTQMGLKKVIPETVVGEGAAGQGYMGILEAGTSTVLVPGANLVNKLKDTNLDYSKEVAKDPTELLSQISPGSQPLTTAYTPPDVSLPGTSPVKPVITPETVTSEDIAIAVQTLEDAGIRSKDIQEDILTLAGFLPPKTQGSTVGTTADTTAIIDPLAQVAADTTTDTRADTTTDTTTDTTVDTTVDTTADTLRSPFGLGLDLGLPSQLGLGLQPVRVKTPEAGDLDYIYDFSSIFATPEQEKLFTRPYRTYNNRIQDSTDELLRLIGANAYV